MPAALHRSLREEAGSDGGPVRILGNSPAIREVLRDVDVAEETARLTRNNILQQAAISILSQANVQPQSALQLLNN